MKEKLLEIFLNDFNHPLDIDELFEMLGLSDAHDFTVLAKCLNELEDEFIITHNLISFQCRKNFYLTVMILLFNNDNHYCFVLNSIYHKDFNMSTAFW